MSHVAADAGGVRADNLRGAGLMVAAMAAFTLNDATVKFLGGTLTLAQILFLRGAVSTLLLVVVARRMQAIRLDLPAREWRLIAVRSLAELGATYFFLTALLNMPLANITAIMQALPLTVTLTAALVFRERLGWRRLLAILVGFGGVMLIVRPGPDGFDAWSLLALGAVASVTVRDLAARRLARSTPSVLVALVGAVLVTAIAGGLMLRDGWQPLTATEAGLAGLAGVFVFVGYYASVATMRVGDVGFVAPFRYTGLVWALVLGYLVFGDWPQPLTLAGAGIVVATGLFTLYRQRRLAARRG